MKTFQAVCCSGLAIYRLRIVQLQSKRSGMEDYFPATREEFYHVQMDIKHVQAVQINHADRILRLEKRQADDAALKSVWSSPFPSLMGGTPQHGQSCFCIVLQTTELLMTRST